MMVFLDMDAWKCPHLTTEPLPALRLRLWICSVLNSASVEIAYVAGTFTNFIFEDQLTCNTAALQVFSLFPVNVLNS